MDFTTRLALSKPDPDPVTGDDVDVQVLNDNFDALDAVVSFTVCTSTARPSAPFAGQAILETDTGNLYVWGGSAWLPLLGNTPQFNQIGIGVVPSTIPQRLIRTWGAGGGSSSQVLLQTSSTASGHRAISTKGGTDTDDRWWVDFDGSMQWGPGTGGDVSLKRTAVGRLKLDGTLEVTQPIDSTGIVKVVSVSGTTDSLGFLTVTHGQPWTPAGVWFISTAPATSFAQAWGVDTIGATTCRLRLASANGGAYASAAVSGRLFLVK